MTYEEASDYLDSFINYERVDGYDYRRSIKLSRAIALLDGLGNPQRNFKAIHIAGTKGKGSTCAFVYSILKESGLKAGLYTSPHLMDFRERIRISQPKDRAIDKEEIAVLVGRLKPFLDKFASSSKFGSPSFFEVYTALAFLFFSIKRIDVAVLEVGLGGRLDATNVVEPMAVGITPISFDHTDKLGHTLEMIALEKCGVIKEGSTVVSSEQAEPVAAYIEKFAGDKNARLYEIGRDIFYEPLASGIKGQTFNVRGIFERYDSLSTSLLGKYQVANAAAAIGIVEALRFNGITVPAPKIADGVRNASWPGRLQVIRSRPFVVLDGAQNEASARALKEAVTSIFPYRNLILVIGISSDKDIDGIGRNLLPISSRVVFTRANSPRAASPQELKRKFRSYGKNGAVSGGVEEAVEAAMREAGPQDLVLVTGSLYVVGEALALFCRRGLCANPFEGLFSDAEN